jgi:hypothetical protein
MWARYCLYISHLPELELVAARVPARIYLKVNRVDRLPLQSSCLLLQLQIHDSYINPIPLLSK